MVSKSFLTYLLSTAMAISILAMGCTARRPSTTDDGGLEGRRNFTTDDGLRYDGEVKLEGGWLLANGPGTATYPDGSRYEGEFRHGRPNGHGTILYGDGGRYVGEVRDGMRHGRGTMTLTDGTRYEGQWANNKPEGNGNLVLPNGETIAGVWRDGEYAGEKLRGEVKIDAGFLRGIGQDALKALQAPAEATR